MLQTENCGGSQIKEIVCEDMISELPEDLLVMILDLVPTKDAVTTMFLSKRWLSIWTMTRRLEYKDSNKEDDDSDIDDDDEHKENNNEEKVEDESKKSVWWFLDKSLQHHKAPVIDRLCMQLGRMCPTDADVGKWVANAVDRCANEIKLKLLWSADPTSLPKSLYSSKYLMTLTLSHQILVDVPSSASLPSLTRLALYYVVYKNNDSLVRFLSSCPVLEKLLVKRDQKDDNVTNFIIKVRSLLYLEYYNFRRLPIDTDVGDTGKSLVIDTPALTYFRIYDYFTGDSCSFEMPCLDTAMIFTDSCLDDKFLKSISSVLHLELVLTDAMVVCCSTINFSRLIEFKMLPEKSDWMEPVMLLLGNAPKLKHLSVDYIFVYQPKVLPLSWNQPSSVPECLLSQLETFEWKKYGGREEEERFLTYVLANSKCLKTATISLRPIFNLEEQQMMMEGLKDIHRVSTESQLMFKTQT